MTRSGVCGSCGAGTDSRFCESCGSPVAHACPRCAAVVAEDAVFCEECGTSLDAGGTPTQDLSTRAAGATSDDVATSGEVTSTAPQSSVGPDPSRDASPSWPPPSGPPAAPVGSAGQAPPPSGAKSSANAGVGTPGPRRRRSGAVVLVAGVALVSALGLAAATWGVLADRPADVVAGLFDAEEQVETLGDDDDDGPGAADDDRQAATADADDDSDRGRDDGAGDDDVRVPDVVGEDVRTARQELAAVGLRADPDSSTGEVVDQDPRGGIVEAGTTVRLTVVDTDSDADESPIARREGQASGEDAAALRTYGADPDVPSWIVVLESLEEEDFTPADGADFVEEFAGEGIDDAALLHSDDYEPLNRGYWVVYLPGFATEDDALAACNDVSDVVPHCYPREISTRR